MNSAYTLRRALCGGLALLSVSSWVTAHQVQSPAAAPLSAVEVEALGLLRTLRDPNSDGPPVVAERLHTLGAEVLERLLTTLEERRVPDPLDPAGRAQVLSESQTEALLGALGAFGRARCLPVWESHFIEPLELPSKAAAVLALGAIGEARDLDRLWKLAGIATQADLVEPLRSQLELAIAMLLRRNPDAYSRLESSWSSLPDSWIDELVRAVGSNRDSQGLALLAHVHAWSPEQRRLVASQIPLVGASNDTGLNRSLSAALLEQAASPSRDDAQAAIQALGVLEDFRVTADLISRLDDPRPGIAESAHHALGELTHKSMSASGGLWHRWHEEELRWQRESKREVFARLEGVDELQALAALREVARHRLHRHELALEVLPALRSESVAVRVMATQVLAELDSRWTVSELIDALSDPAELVRAGAHSALVRITGRQRGSLPSDWEDLVESPGR